MLFNATPSIPTEIYFDASDKLVMARQHRARVQIFSLSLICRCYFSRVKAR